MALRDEAIRLVSDLQGIKGVDLVLGLAIFSADGNANADEITKTISDLVNEGEIVEIEYVLPLLAFRTKSFYLPKGTEAHLVEGEVLR